MFILKISLGEEHFTSCQDLQEVFLQIWSKRDTLNINTNPLAYLKRAVINRSLNQIKSRKRIVEESQMAEMQSSNTEATENLAAQDLEVVMKKALDTLPERCRMIFVMRRLEGISLKEIAQQLEISPKTVENQITKALKVLQKAVRPFVEKEN